MTAFSEEETNALVRGRIHELEIDISFTIDGVNVFDYGRTYGTRCKNNIELWLYKDIVSSMNRCLSNDSIPKHIRIRMEEAIQNKRYFLSYLDSDGIEKPMTPDVITDGIMFGPKGAVSKLEFIF